MTAGIGGVGLRTSTCTVALVRGAFEQPFDPAAHRLLELLGDLLRRPGSVRSLELARVDGAGGVRDRRLQYLRGPEHESCLENGEQQCEKRNSDEPELDRGGAVLIAAEGAQAQASAGPARGTRDPTDAHDLRASCGLWHRPSVPAERNDYAKNLAARLVCPGNVAASR